MPSWDKNGNEEWVCQKGAHICTGSPTWVEGVGNVCDRCLASEKVSKSLGQAFNPDLSCHTNPIQLSLYEHCRLESGLTGVALDKYIRRHYGHN